MGENAIKVFDVKQKIERCEELIKPEHANWIGISNQEAIRELLNKLKEKDEEINRKSSTIKALQCALHERTEERDRKDYIIARQKKQIDLMAEKIFQEGIVWDDKEEVKQYFKSKVEKE